jgi:hypothetical protein
VRRGSSCSPGSASPASAGWPKRSFPPVSPGSRSWCLTHRPRLIRSAGDWRRFLETLRKLGYIDGQNIRLDFRFAENRLDLLPGLAAELVNGQRDVIYTYTTAGALAAARAATRIPIIVGSAGEAVMERLAPEGFDFFTPIGYANI